MPAIEFGHPLVFDHRLPQTAHAFHHVNQIINNALLQTHHYVKIAQSNIGVNSHNFFPLRGQRGAAGVAEDDVHALAQERLAEGIGTDAAANRARIAALSEADALTWDARDQASGIYFYEVRAAGQVKVGKMALLK